MDLAGDSPIRFLDANIGKAYAPPRCPPDVRPMRERGAARTVAMQRLGCAASWPVHARKHLGRGSDMAI